MPMLTSLPILIPTFLNSPGNYSKFFKYKIQVQKNEFEHYSQNFPRLLKSIRISFLQAIKSSQKVENSMAISDFLLLHIYLCLITVFLILTYRTYFTNKYLWHKKLCCLNRKTTSHRSHAAYQNYVSHKKLCCDNNKV